MTKRYNVSYETSILKTVNKRKINDIYYPRLKTNYEQSNYENKIVIPNFNAFFKFVKKYNVVNADDVVLTLTDIFHRILYFVEDKEKDYKFLYKEFLNIVDYNTSYLFENILECLKILLEDNKNLSIEPFFKELEDMSKYFDKHYLNDKIKMLVYKVSFYLNDYLDDDMRKRLEKLLFKVTTTKEEPNYLKSYTSSMANYLYVLNIDRSNMLEHEKVLKLEDNKDVIYAFGKDIISEEIGKTLKNFVRKI